ncbi:MAG: hypothetical protein NT165_02430 [Candidatus Falkowbacteria bacterium]|nr:hypothetical protein [Candidatus Falkowbacteria bacterium]
MKRKKIIKAIFVALIVVNTILIILVPFVMPVKFHNWVEVLVIFGLFLVIYLTHFFYFKETKQLRRYQGDLEEKLLDSFKYIGTVNLQLEEIRKNLFNFNKYPSSKKEFISLMSGLAEKILSIINIDWVIIKIVDLSSGKTIHYTALARGGKDIKFDKFDNRQIFSGECGDSCTVIRSNQESLDIKAFCIVPLQIKGRDDKFFITHIINQLELLFLAFRFLEKKEAKKK